MRFWIKEEVNLCFLQALLPLRSLYYIQDCIFVYCLVVATCLCCNIYTFIIDPKAMYLICVAR